MLILTRPDDLSDGAWKIVQAVCKVCHYDQTSFFNDFNKLAFSKEELSQYCNELHEKRYAFWHDRDTDSMYLFALGKLLRCYKS